MAITKKSHRPNELAPHVATLFAYPEHAMEAVIISMNKAVSILLDIEPTTKDLKNLDYGIPYALHFEKSDKYNEKIRAAGKLLRMCLHAIERGKANELDKLHIPIALAALSGYDNSHKTGGISRNRKQSDLKSRLAEVAKNHPTDTCKELLIKLEGDNDITKFDAEYIYWKDDNENEMKTKFKTFENWLTRIKNPT